MLERHGPWTILSLSSSRTGDHGTTSPRCCVPMNNPSQPWMCCAHKHEPPAFQPLEKACGWDRRCDLLQPDGTMRTAHRPPHGEIKAISDLSSSLDWTIEVASILLSITGPDVMARKHQSPSSPSMKAMIQGRRLGATSRTRCAGHLYSKILRPGRRAHRRGHQTRRHGAEAERGQWQCIQDRQRTSCSAMATSRTNFDRRRQWVAPYFLEQAGVVECLKENGSAESWSKPPTGEAVRWKACGSGGR